jgi:MFS family permease
VGLVKNYESLLALRSVSTFLPAPVLTFRFCLGIFEAGLFPGLNFFLTGWYRREEINKRVAVFFGGAVLAGAFGGIFGYALSRMAGIGGLNGWQWIVSLPSHRRDRMVLI